MPANSPPPRAARRTSSAAARTRLFTAAAAAAVSGAAALLTAHSARAQTWVGPGGGNFSGSFQTASNWNPAAVPQPTSIASFSLNQSYTVTFSTNAASSTLIFANTSGVTTFGAAGVTRAYTILNNAVFAGGGTAVLGNLDLNVLGVLSVRTNNVFRVLGASTLLANTLSLGDSGAGASATISVEGDAAELRLTGEVFHNVGRSGDTGTLTFSNNAIGTLAGGLNLADPGTAGSRGFLNVLSGADVTTEAINAAPAAVSKLVAGITVSGTGSTLSVTNGGQVVLGAASQSKATLDVLAGGTANLRHTDLTINPTATVTVNNATLLTSGQVNVGGLMTVTNGAQLTHNEMTGFFRGFAVGTADGGANALHIGGAGTGVLIFGPHVGADGPGTVNQSGGAVTFLASTRVGAPSGSNGAGAYQLAGGTLTTDDLAIGGLQSAGTFTQSGGTHTVNVVLRVASVNGGNLGSGFGSNTFPTGTYSLSGGTLNAATVWVGNSSTGIVNHTGGTMTVTGELTLGGIVNGNTILFPEGPAVAGSYTLSNSAALNATTERVGWTAPGTFTHTGGSNTVTGKLVVGDFGAGTYAMSGGTLTAPNIVVADNGAGGTFTHTGGAVTVSAGTALASLTLGNSLTGTGTYNLGGASAVLQGTGIVRVGETSNGVFNHTAGSNTLAGVALGDFPGASGTYTISGGTLDTAGAITVGNFGSGTFVQKTGAAVKADLVLVAFQGGSAGTYDLRGGTLDAQSLGVHADGVGSFLQSGGVATIGSLRLGNGPGTNRAQALLSGGTLHAVAEQIGVLRDGNFNQIGGTNTADTSITIGSPSSPVFDAPNPRGQYTISGGTLAAPRVVVDANGVLSIAGNLPRVDVPDLVVRGALLTTGGSTGPTLTGNTTLAPGSSSDFRGGLIVAGTLTLQDAAAGAAGNLPIALSTPAATLTGAGSVLPDVTNAGTIQADGGNLVLRGASLTNTGALRNTAGASLFVKAATLTNGGNVVVNAGGSVVFDQPLSVNSGKTVVINGGTLGTPRLTNNPGGVVSGFGQVAGDFDNAAAATFLGPAQIVGNFSNRAGATLTVRNDQTLITGVTTNNGTITTQNGKVIFDGGLAAAPVPAPLPAGLLTSVSKSLAEPTPDTPSVTLTGASTLVAPYLRNQSLTLSGSAAAPAVAAMRPKVLGGRTSVLTALTIPVTAGQPVGRLDLADTTLILDYAAVDPSPLATIRDLVTAGFHAGDWLGNGVTSSSAALDRTRALGYADAAAVLPFTGGSATFAGIVVDPSSVLVRYTVAGDATLDGVVNFDDLLALAKGYNKAAAVWSQGDYNYDAVVNFDDLLILAKNYNKVQPVAAIPGAAPELAADVASAFAQVPEPSAAVLIAACGFAVSTRRTARPTR
jgi:hypothetical protein